MIRTLPKILDALAKEIHAGRITTEQIAKRIGLKTARRRAIVSRWIFSRKYEPSAASALLLAALVDKLRKK